MGHGAVDPQYITAFSVAAAFVIYVLDRVITLVKALRDGSKDSDRCSVAHAQQSACLERITDTLTAQTDILRALSENQRVLLERVPRRSYTPKNMEAVRDLEESRRRNLADAKKGMSEPPTGGRQTRR